LTPVQHEVDPASLGDALEKRLGITLQIYILYFSHLRDGQALRLGLIYIPPAPRILVPARDIHSEKGKIIVQEGTIYCRRNTRSTRATSDDLEKIYHRISRTNVASEVKDEASLFQTIAQSYPSAIDEIWMAIGGKQETTAQILGFKLRQLWGLHTKHSKKEFAQLLQITPSKIDAYFDGREILDMPRLLAATKMFQVSPELFFVPTVYMEKPVWQSDSVKHVILSLVRPRSKILYVRKNSGFYGGVMYEFAKAISQLHDTLYPENQANGWASDATETTLSETFRADLAHQYYKLLEQYPWQNDDRRLTKTEQILFLWASATEEYLTRLIVEGISTIRIADTGNPLPKFRFIADLQRGEVCWATYDSTNFRMRTQKRVHRPEEVSE
jgi:hypothetical protein